MEDGVRRGYVAIQSCAFPTTLLSGYRGLIAPNPTESGGGEKHMALGFRWRELVGLRTYVPLITQRSTGVGRIATAPRVRLAFRKPRSGPTRRGSMTPSRTARRGRRWAPVVAGSEGHESRSTIVVLVTVAPMTSIGCRDLKSRFSSLLAADLPPAPRGERRSAGGP